MYYCDKLAHVIIANKVTRAKTKLYLKFKLSLCYMDTKSVNFPYQSNMTVIPSIIIH